MTQEHTVQLSMYCRQCGYALFGLSENRCPECGQAFDPADSRTFFRHPRSGPLRRWIKRIALALTVAVLLVAIFVAACFGWVYWQYHADWQAEQEALAELRVVVGNPNDLNVSLERLGSSPLYRLTDPLSFVRHRVASIAINGPAQGEVNLAHLSTFKCCRGISLCNLGIPDAQLGQLEGLKQLGYLELEGNPAVTDAGLVHLKDLSSLTGLVLRGTSVSGSGLRYLQETCRLGFLAMGDAQVHSVDLAELKGFGLLGILRLGGLPVTDADLAHLKPLRVYDISLNRTRITDTGLAEVGQMSSLVILDVSDTAITDAGLQHLSGLPHLYSLHVNNTAITDEGLKHLKSFPSLYRLYARGTKITVKGIQQLHDSRPFQSIDGP